MLSLPPLYAALIHLNKVLCLGVLCRGRRRESPADFGKMVPDFKKVVPDLVIEHTAFISGIVMSHNRTRHFQHVEQFAVVSSILNFFP